jgi:hypothetical protein
MTITTRDEYEAADRELALLLAAAGHLTPELLDRLEELDAALDDYLFRTCPIQHRGTAGTAGEEPGNG